MKFNHQETEKKLFKIFKKIFKVKSSKVNDLSLQKISTWDSLQHILLVKEIEKNFKIRIDDIDLPELISFSKIIKYIIKKNEK